MTDTTNYILIANSVLILIAIAVVIVQINETNKLKIQVSDLGVYLHTLKDQQNPPGAISIN